MKKIVNHFKKIDPILHAAIVGTSWQQLSRAHDPFTGLCRIIIGQQVSTKAAQSIFTKFAALFPRKTPTAANVLSLSDALLRSAGLSQGKTNAIRDLALRVKEKTLDLKSIPTRHNDDVIAMLIQVKGIGPWSAEMFLIFYLGREDVFSPGDLGLRTAIMRLYKKKTMPSPEAAAKLAERWSPYRSYACRILWESLNNNPQL